MTTTMTPTTTTALIATIEVAGDFEFSFPDFDSSVLRLLLWDTDDHGRRRSIVHIWECENNAAGYAPRRLRREADKAAPGHGLKLTPSVFRKAHRAARDKRIADYGPY